MIEALMDDPPKRQRARTESIKRLSKRELERCRIEYPPEVSTRPATWGECQARELGTDAHPCPYCSCRWNLRLDVDPHTGSIRTNFPDRDFDELPETCALRVADRDSMQLEQLGETLNLTSERVRQIETTGLDALARKHAAKQLADEVGLDPSQRSTARHVFVAERERRPAAAATRAPEPEDEDLAESLYALADPAPTSPWDPEPEAQSPQESPQEEPVQQPAEPALCPCGKPATLRKRGQCRACYLRAYRAEHPRAARPAATKPASEPAGACVICGEPCKPRRKNSTPGLGGTCPPHRRNGRWWLAQQRRKGVPADGAAALAWLLSRHGVPSSAPVTPPAVVAPPPPPSDPLALIEDAVEALASAPATELAARIADLRAALARSRATLIAQLPANLLAALLR